MSIFYTAAEIDAMDAAIEAKIATDSGEPLDAAQAIAKSTIPAIVAFKDILPISIVDLNGDEVTMVSYKDVHSALGIKTACRTWFARVCEKGRFVEGEDYITLSHDATTREGCLAINANGGQAVYDRRLTADMAKEIGMMDTSEVGKKVRQYFLTAERVAKTFAKNEFAKALGQTKKELLGATSWGNKMQALAEDLAKKNGHNTVSSAQTWSQHEKLAEQAAEKSKVVSQAGAQVQSMVRIISGASKHLKSVSSNPDKVKAAAAELAFALGEIQSGNMFYTSYLN